MSFIDNNKSIYTINTYVENEKQNSNECCETCRRLKRKVNDLEVTVGELEKTVKGLDLRQTQLENTVKELKTKQTVPNSTETEKYFKDRIKQLLVAEKDKSGAPSKESKFTSTSKNSVVMIFHNRDFKGSGFVIHSDEVMSDNVELKSYLCVVTSKHVVCTAPGEKTERTSLCGLKVQNGDWSIGILEVVKVIPDTVADVSLLLVVMNLQDDTPIFSSFIQCSMTIREGFSGSPGFVESGEVMGMVKSGNGANDQNRTVTLVRLVSSEIIKEAFSRLKSRILNALQDLKKST
uniref:uncharacterized protein LOC108949620 isoform X2 n=1 Tax=Ciona intestinalis TaxID=7719 RepID=UPI00089DC9BB|nr:uncharacterized protein LOC108949620 isoform X2 [Ciona intestinalis]|eukprot:XP_018668044.1 uncharacterized protein LOC108949620 isoform X2 [Ciona intestinalis]